MPKNNELANRVNNSTSVSTFTNDTGNKAPEQENTFLTDSNIRLLQRVFKDKEKYIEYMKTLFALRGLAIEQCETTTGGYLDYDKQHPSYRILELTNSLIGALYHEGIFFEFDGKNVYHHER